MKGNGGVQPHLFDGIPIIPMLNNEQMMGDAEKALKLIDAYDAVLSSTGSEIEQLRMAYMFVKGSGMDVGAELVRDLEQTGIFPLSEDGEVGFVNKQINDTVVKDLLSELRRNIYQFAKSIDMSKDFGGDMRVMGWQVALLNLENNSKITERKFTRALREQYRMLSEYWRAVGYADIDPASLSYTFTRNFPKDNFAEAQTLEIIANHISKRTAFGMMSFIDDPEMELTRLEEERELSPFRMDDANTGFSGEQQADTPDDGAAGERSGP
jgi:SPP1 family phage portal protein